jgi:hypothetical protein
MRPLILVAGSLLLTTLIICTAYAEQQKAPTPASAPSADAGDAGDARDLEIARLKLQIQKLEAEKELLALQLKVSDKKVADLERAGARLPAADEVRVAPYVAPRLDSGSINPFNAIVPQSNTTPKNWVPREFNGQTYYLIPLSETQEASGIGTLTITGGTVKLRNAESKPAPATKP